MNAPSHASRWAFELTGSTAYRWPSREFFRYSPPPLFLTHRSQESAIGRQVYPHQVQPAVFGEQPAEGIRAVGVLEVEPDAFPALELDVRSEEHTSEIQSLRH